MRTRNAKRTEVLPQPEPHGVRHAKVPVPAPPPQQPLVHAHHLGRKGCVDQGHGSGLGSICRCHPLPIQKPLHSYPDEGVPVGAARVREDGEAEVVPVDDERRPAQAGRQPRHGEGGDAWRVLHEDELWAGQAPEEQVEQLQNQRRDLDGGEEEEASLPV